MRHLASFLPALGVLLLLGSVSLAGSSPVEFPDDGSWPVVTKTAIFQEGLQFGLTALGILALAAGTVALALGRVAASRVAMAALVALSALALLHQPVLAQAVATEGGQVLGTTGGSTVVTLPYGEWVAGLQAGLVTVLTMIATAVVAWLPFPIRWAVNLYGVDKLVKDAVGFAIAATPGASRDAKFQVDVGSQVLARAFQKAVDDAPPRLIKAAGGIEGLQEKILAHIPLAEGTSARDIVDKVPSTPALRLR